MPAEPAKAGGPGRVLFWALSAALVAYVALCTGFRDSILEADAWEHHRAIVALAHDLRHPGNPTFAVETTSIRYSPYTVGLAALSRATGMDPWNALSLGAVVNTVLLCVGVRVLLRALGRVDASGLALLVMVSLYGGAPGYANSYALADLPWHQVNPSAFAFGVVLLSWALFIRLASGRGPAAAWVALPLMLGSALLDHAMTGLLGFLGLGIFSVFTGAEGMAERVRRLVIVAAIGVGAGVVCLAWPWYSFLRAVTTKPDNAYWFNPAILRLMLTQWCAPAIVLSLWAITARDRKTVGVLLAGGAAALALGVLAMLAHSASLARLPLPGLIFFHLAIGVAAADYRVLNPGLWRARLFDLVVAGPATARAAFTLAACVTIAYFLVPQLAALASEPQLARAYIAPLLHRPDKQPRLRSVYHDLLALVRPGEVVLGERATSWPVPSFGPRIVAASHYEFFVGDQPARDRDVDTFFSTPDEAERLAILDRYHATWILVDESRLSDAQKASLIRPGTVESRAGSLVLMNAERWRQR